MFGFLNQDQHLPPLSAFHLDRYEVDFSLENLSPGVDNVRHDVSISPTFVATTRKIAFQLIRRHAGSAYLEPRPQETGWGKEVDTYKQQYRALMLQAVNQAKGRRETQVIFLCQAAIVKLLLEELNAQFDHFVGGIKQTVRKVDLVDYNDTAESPKLKDHLQRIIQERVTILRTVGLEMCSFWAEVEIKDIMPMREAIFGQGWCVFLDLLANPLLYSDQLDNELFTIAEYDLALGRRLEDADKYENLLFFLRRLINQLDVKNESERPILLERRLTSDALEDEVGEKQRQEYNQKIEGWLKGPQNIDKLVNWQATKAELYSQKKAKADRETLFGYQEMLRSQKRALHFFYRQFTRKKLMDRIAASYEIQPEYLEYCPPLGAHQIVQYLVDPKSRKGIKSRLKRLQKLYGRSFSLRPLNKKIKSMEQMTVTKRKLYLARFLNSFSRYHRDYSNCLLLLDAMQRVNLAYEEKILSLSRENNTLYEFLLPHEQVSTKAPIINHVVIKGDLRGSTDITYQMNARGLNPASYFSLNFFDPISEILSEYDAAKIFIEGDAIILAIFEREDTPGGWYGVARACGMALNMLIIIQHYNEKNKKNQLPELELGVGISFQNQVPTFLFDGSNRIMISSAINQADRLSSCSKTARRMFERRKGPFNLYAFQTVSDEAIAGTADDLLTRYNVNGIELNQEGFAKLSNEIDLKLLKYDLGGGQDRSMLYTGKFPTKSGRYQRLIIREAQIPVIDPSTLKIVRVSSRKYYEVCTHPKLYKWVRQNQG